MRTPFKLCALFVLGLTATGQQMVTVGATRDNTLYEDTLGSLSNGAGSRLFVGLTGQGRITRSVLYFDLTGAIPVGSLVTSVTFDARITNSAVGALGPVDHSLHRLLASWGEGNSVAASGQGGGGPAEPGDATWAHRFFPGTLWATQGGDFAASASATGGAPTSGAFSLSTSGLVADVQAWVNDPASNFGWLLRADNEVSPARVYTSREGGTSTTTPRVTVTFEAPVGVAYCSPGVANSSGAPGVTDAVGSATVLDDHLTLSATSLSLNSFGFFIASRAQTNVAQPGGSQGVLCVGGNIGRYVGPGQIRNSGATGSFTLALDLNAMPTPTGLVAASAGESWYFQAWHRDANPGVTSNFTSGVCVTFL